MSEKDQELETLGRRLDGVFAATRPRRGFPDELWQRLERRRPWWRRMPSGWVAGGASLAGAAAVLVLAVGVAGHLPRGGASGSAYSSAAAPAGGAFGRLPRPPATGGLADQAQLSQPPTAIAAAAAPLYAGRIDATVSASVPAVSGTVIRGDGASAQYPPAAPGVLAAAARSEAAGLAVIFPDGHVPTVTLDGAIAITVPVRDGQVTYSEPAVAFTGAFDYQGRHYLVRIVVSAIDPRYLRP